MAWLESIGVVTQDASKLPPDFDSADLPRATSQPARKPGKRRAADGTEGAPRRRTGLGRQQQDENGISFEVQVRPFLCSEFLCCGPRVRHTQDLQQDLHCPQEAYRAFPELFQWVTAQPSEAILKAFVQYNQDLSCAPQCPSS